MLVIRFVLSWFVFVWIDLIIFQFAAFKETGDAVTTNVNSCPAVFRGVPLINTKGGYLASCAPRYNFKVFFPIGASIPANLRPPPRETPLKRLKCPLAPHTN
jgi:hypothetical protein